MLALKGQRELEHRRNRFYALFKGVDLDEEKDGGGEVSAFEQTQIAAQAALAGMSTDEFIFDAIGIDIDIDEDILELQKLEQELN